jgi:uncharacterized iron-regulated membrane protein
MANMTTTETRQQPRDKSAWIGLNPLLKKIHMYIGLLNFSILFVFGVAGLTATFESSPQDRQDEAVERLMPFTAPPNATDKEVADAVHALLKIPLTQSPPKPALRRDADKNLTFNFFNPNGVTGVTVLEKEQRLRIRTLPNNTGRFMNVLHKATIQHPMAKRDLRIKLWTWYNEFSIWSLMLMALSGIYLWLSSRPGFLWAQVSFVAGCAVFIVLYIVTR